MSRVLCPTCRRRLSERLAGITDKGYTESRCPDPLHDLADRCVELRDQLSYMRKHHPEDRCEDMFPKLRAERDALTARVAELEREAPNG